MSVVEGLKTQIHVCGTYFLSVWFTLLIGFGSVWIFSRYCYNVVYVKNYIQDRRVDPLGRGLCQSIIYQQLIRRVLLLQVYINQCLIKKRRSRPIQYITKQPQVFYTFFLKKSTILLPQPSARDFETSKDEYYPQQATSKI